MTKNKTLQAQQTANLNLSVAERWASIVSGGALAALALRQRGALGVVLGLMSWYLTNRGISGHDTLYDRFGVNTAIKTSRQAVSVPHEQGIHVVKSVIIERSPEELYSYWRSFENLPSIMRHLESVKVIDNTRSHWVAKGPAGNKIEWDAEIINEVPNEVIGWRSLNDAEIAHAGSVRFQDVGNGSTEVKVTLEYVPPAGKLGQVIAQLMGEEPEIQLDDDLHRFKRLVETGTTLSGWQGVDEMGQGGSEKSTKSRSKKSDEFNQPADQAEGERGGGTSSKVGKTPGQAEG